MAAFPGAISFPKLRDPKNKPGLNWKLQLHEYYPIFGSYLKVPIGSLLRQRQHPD